MRLPQIINRQEKVSISSFSDEGNYPRRAAMLCCRMNNITCEIEEKIVKYLENIKDNAF